MSPSTAAVLSALELLGIPLILLAFYLDGLIVGKITPPAALYVVYVAVYVPPNGTLLAVAAASAVAATLGQFTVYRGFNEESPEFVGIRRRVPYVDRMPFLIHERVGERRVAIVAGLFDRFGGAALAVTNAIPGIRSLMAIPAGLSSYPRARFLLFSTIGNALYVVLLTAAALGLVDLAGLVPTP
ncbi:hypothetical protein JCM17823_28880 [Halorubrum gandharaense]